MKLKTGQQRYKFPAHSQIVCGYVDGNQRYNQMHSYAMQTMLVEGFKKELDKRRGFPTIFTVWNEWIEFWPIPDKPYSVTVQYVPPIEQW